MLTGDEKDRMMARLRRIEGQVAGIQRMVAAVLKAEKEKTD